MKFAGTASAGNETEGASRRGAEATCPPILNRKDRQERKEDIQVKKEICDAFAILAV